MLPGLKVKSSELLRKTVDGRNNLCPVGGWEFFLGHTGVRREPLLLRPRALHGLVRRRDTACGGSALPRPAELRRDHRLNSAEVSQPDSA